MRRNAPWQRVEIGPCTLYLGDCTEVMAALEPSSVHSVVTDPPYELGFMGKAWDKAGGVASTPATWAHALAALKPGGHLVAFAGSRTYHRIACAIEDAGFDIRDQLMWIYGSGFPKGRDIARDIDAHDARPDSPEDALRFTAWLRSTGISAATINAATASHMASHYLTAGSQPAIPTREHFDKLRPLLPSVPKWVAALVSDRAERMVRKAENLSRREAVGHHDKAAQASRWREDYGGHAAREASAITAAHTEAARQWAGWSTTLKPAHEPIVFARKPFNGSVAGCVLAHGTGAINVDGCRVEGDGWRRPGSNAVGGIYGDFANDSARSSDEGRWPANVITDGSLEVVEHFPAAARDAVRFFYAPKADRAERDFGLRDGGVGALRDGGRAAARVANFHPTVKPVDLMRWLCRLITPPGGVVLEPFLGSGSTGIAAVRENFRFVGIERDPDYFDIACRRISAAVAERERAPDLLAKATPQRTHQLALF